MASSRIILGALLLFLMVLIVLSAGRIINSFKNKFKPSPSQEQILSGKITITAVPVLSTTPTATKPVVFEGKEIPGTGPATFAYLVIGGGFISGFYLRRKS